MTVLSIILEVSAITQKSEIRDTILEKKLFGDNIIIQNTKGSTDILTRMTKYSLMAKFKI